MRFLAAISMVLCFCLAAGPAAADEVGPAGEIKEFTVGQISVMPVLDRTGSMKAELFSGPLSAAERLALMPGGEVPSSVNIFLIKSEAGHILVDAGWGWSGPGKNHFPRRLRQAGLTEADIDYVILTHMHPDHIGGLVNGPEAFFPKARVLVAQAELDYWSGQVAQRRQVRESVDGTGDNRERPLEPSENSSDPPPAPGASADQADELSLLINRPVPAGDLQEAVLTAYAGRIKTFSFGDEVLPGLASIEAVGHTPGHTAFLLSSGDDALLFVGDILHAAALQFPEPDECASYDMDPARAVASRRAILGLAAEKSIPVAGAHVPFSGVGQVRADDGHGFAFTPAIDVLN